MRFEVGEVALYEVSLLTSKAVNWFCGPSNSAQAASWLPGAVLCGSRQCDACGMDREDPMACERAQNVAKIRVTARSK